ncbi:DUF2793 domain-containing protein [Qipengyuania aquimaris]|uniref:DUF2793 domain-containing protein n=1 Tax=Qipengyuania aquimaris TaxID=255984 RepID=UPI001FD0E714|nr:DUF2793 domain-containing protein [Qipengyuania aquimaris]UOR16309.1 DUF2793 domain-containing protein [Qipengyuania aquimaris]
MTQVASLTSSTSRYGLPLLFSGQSQKEFTVNEALARLDLLTHPAVEQELADPPPNPSAGDCYIVGTSATGDWAGHDASLAGWDGTQWTFVEPRDGMAIRCLSDGSLRQYSGGWQGYSAPLDPHGGSTVDIEARTAIAELITLLKAFGIFS